MGFEFAFVLAEVQREIHLATDQACPGQMAWMDVYSSHRMRQVEDYPATDSRETSKTGQEGQEGHADEFDAAQGHQGQSGTHAMVAIVRSRNDGRLAGSDALVHDSDSFPGLDSTLGLCACPYREGHGDQEDRGQRSTDLSAPEDSYGIQP